MEENIKTLIASLNRRKASLQTDLEKQMNWLRNNVDHTAAGLETGHEVSTTFVPNMVSLLLNLESIRAEISSIDNQLNELHLIMNCR